MAAVVVAAHATPVEAGHRQVVGRAEFIALIVGVGALAIPTLISLAQFHWSTESGAHGPIILVSGLWLLWQGRKTLEFRPGEISPWWLLLLAPLLALYVYARSVSLLGTESAALYLTLVLLAFFYWGTAAVRRQWFAILYLGFLIKPPYSMVAELTQPLKIALSQLSVDLLQSLGYPIASSGVLIQIAQYELLVKQACAGLGSLITLLALGLLFVHLTRPARRAHSVLLLLAIIPVALLANLLRVIVLILLTYHFGDAVAQGFAHDVAGLATFALSLFGMLAVDRLLATIYRTR